MAGRAFSEDVNSSARSRSRPIGGGVTGMVATETGQKLEQLKFLTPEVSFNATTESSAIVVAYYIALSGKRQLLFIMSTICTEAF